MNVPAWKRLGLKLKYANERTNSAEVVGLDQISTQIPHQSDAAFHDRAHKRQRTSDDTAVDVRKPHQSHRIQNLSQPNGLKTPEQSSDNSQKGSNTNVHKTPKRKKSVTFSNDTKDDDGDTRTTIDFPIGSPGSTPRKANTMDHAANSPSKAVNGDTLAESDGVVARTKLKPSAQNRKLKRLDTIGKGKNDSALDYLQTHRTLRESWKFNKNRDIWILNHALDNTAIPNSHALALAGYVNGLPPRAAARQRLVEHCQESLANVNVDDGAGVKNREALSAILEGSSSVSGSSSDELLNNQPRALILLWALGEDLKVSEIKKSTPVPTAAEQRLVERRRKSRTAVPVDLSSSESDSETSSSGSDSSGGKTQGKLNRGVKVPVHNEDTSSSGSDDISSSEDSGSSGSHSD